MAYTAQFQADFSRWDKALSDAKTGLKSFELVGKSVQNQLTKMTNGFSGATIQKEAAIAVTAVKAVGGATKLTEAEQRKVNATVTEAIAKYHALGQQAPAELKKLAAETKQVEKQTSLLGSTAVKVGALMAGAFTLGAVTAAISKTVAYASSIKDMANQTGIGVKRLQELKFAAEQSGVSFDSVGTAIFNIQKSLGKGGEGVNGALAKLGMSLADVKGMRPEDQFQVIASKLGTVKNESDRVAIGTALMGKAFKDVLPLIREGIDQQIAKAREWGVVIDEDAINALENLGDAWDAVKLQGTALIAQVLIPFVPAMTATLNALGPLVSKFAELPKFFIKAQIAFKQFLVQQAEGAVTLLKLSKITNPLGAITGQIDEQIGQARLAAYFFKNDIILLERELANLGKTAEAAAGSPGGGGGGLGEVDRALKTIKDRISGAALIKSLMDLQRAWKSLTPAQKEAAISIGVVVDEYQDLASKLPVLPAQLRAFAIEMNAAAIATGKMVLPIGELKPIIESLGPTLDKSGKAFRDWGAEAGFEQSIERLPFWKSLGEKMTRLPEELTVTKTATLKWRDSLEDVAKAFAVLAQISDGTLSSVFAMIGKIVGSANLMVKSVDSIRKGIDGIGSAKSLTDLVGGIAELTSGILGAAAAAVELGQALWDAFTKSRAEQTAERIGREFGVSVSESFAASIEAETAKFFGNRQAAQIFNLDRIIAEGGGLNSSNVKQLFSRFRDLFSMVETGAFSAAQGIEVLDKNFKAFADFVTKGGSLASKELLEIIDLTERSGLKSAEVAAFVVQETDRALTGLTTFLNNAQVKTQAAADGISAALFGIFEAQSANGVPAAEIIKQLEPLIQKLDEQFKAAGLSGGAAFQTIKDLAAVASHEIAGPLITGVLGLEQALAGLHNSGVLNEEMFDGLTASVADTYAQILATGVDGSKALQLIGPTLQTIWELQQDFGYTVDENTQKLLDEAVAMGTVGNAHRTVQEQMLKLMERQTTALEGIAELFGVDLVNAVDEYAEALENLPDTIPVPRGIPSGGEIPYGSPMDGSAEGTPGRQYAHGTPGLGFVNFGTGRPATLHGMEAVVPFGKRREAAESWGMGDGGTVVTVVVLPHGGTVNDVLRALPKEARRNEAQFGAKLQAALASYGVR